MFLSRLVLAGRDRQARAELTRPYQMHRTLWRAFPEFDPGRILFRVDPECNGPGPVVLVQSELRPCWEDLVAASPRYLRCPPELKEFAPAFTQGQCLHFGLRANPTRRVTAPPAHRGVLVAGKRVALTAATDHVRWLLRKADAGGFRIPGDWRCAEDGSAVPHFPVAITAEGWVHCHKPGHRDGRFLAVRFAGQLEVTDPERFLDTVRAGLGSAKGFGFGLLSLAPLRGSA